MTNPTPFLHYYINTGAEVEYTIKTGNIYKAEVDSYTYKEIFKMCEQHYITSIRFTNLRSIDSLTDEEKAKVHNDVYHQTWPFKFKIKYIDDALRMEKISPQLFHELLKLRIDLFNLMKP